MRGSGSIWHRKTASLALLALAFGLAGGHALLWSWTEQQVAKQTTIWLAAQRAAGWTIQTGATTGGGWPWSADLLLPDMTVSSATPPSSSSLTWHAERVRLRLLLLHPRTLNIVLEGLQTLRIGDLPEVQLAADNMAATLPLDPDSPAGAIDVTAQHLRASRTSPSQVADDAGSVTISDLTLRAANRPATPPALTMAVRATDVGLPAGVDWALGPRIAHLTLEAALDGPLLNSFAPDDRSNSGVSLAARLAAWRDAGGALPIDNVIVDWGPMDLRGSATLALDQNLQPKDTATLRITGWSAAIDALVRAHVIPAGTATAAKAVLALLSHTQPDGRAAAEIPLTDQERTLSFGRIPLVRLPELIWPE